MHDVFQEIRLAVRSLARRPAFTIPAILTLALGIGATTTVYTLVRRILLDPLPFKSSERLVLIEESETPGKGMLVSYPNFADWKQRTRSFEVLAAALLTHTQPMVGAGEPGVVSVQALTKDFFEMMGVAPLAGRTFTADENRKGGARVALVTEAFWRERLGSRRDFGKFDIKLSGTPWTVIGVMPDRFKVLDGGDVFLPADQFPIELRAAGNYHVIGRLAPGATIESATAELSQIAAQLKDQYGDATLSNAVYSTSLREEVIGTARQPLAILLAAAVVLLLVACVNVGLMLLARSAERGQEMAVRAALGARRVRVARQLFIENGALALVGGAIGMVLAGWAVGILRVRGAGMIPRLQDLAIDSRIALFALGATVVATVLFGVFPAVRLTRESFQPLRSLRSTTAAAAGFTTWNVLVALQAALAVVVLVGSALLVRSVNRILTMDTGYDRHNVLSIWLPLPSDRYPGDSARLNFYHRALPELTAIPGVTKAAFINALPMEPTNRSGPVLIPPIVNPESPNEWDAISGFRVISPGYFEAMHIAVERGRIITEQDRAGSPPVAVVNRTLADRLWPGEDPIGKEVRALWDFRGALFTVVGVVGEAREWSRKPGSQSELYISMEQRPEHTDGIYAVLRVDADMAGVARAARARLLALDREIPLTVQTLDDRVRESITDRHFTANVLTGFAAMSLALTLIGIYGVVSYVVARRTKELGIRIAIGADPRRAWQFIQRGTLLPVAAGTVTGMIVAAWLSKLITAQLIAVTSYDSAAYAIAAAIALTAAWVGSYIPARRAARLDPAAIIRGE